VDFKEDHKRDRKAGLLKKERPDETIMKRRREKKKRNEACIGQKSPIKRTLKHKRFNGNLGK